MKEFIQGLITLIGSISVFTPVMVAGLAYSVPYSIWLIFNGTGFGSFFLYWWRVIDGTFAAFGHILFEAAIGWDYLGNVQGGEITEDFVAPLAEDSKFGDKKTTMSASFGELELRDPSPINKREEVISHILNVVFNQAAHAVDSWKYRVHHEAVKASYFSSRKK